MDILQSGIKYENIWQMVISYKINELLSIIHLRFPQDFSYKDIKIIFNIFKNRIKLKNIIKCKYKVNKRKQYIIKEILLDNRCMARCWVLDDINGKQCKRHKNVSSNLCHQHEKYLTHGLITEPLTEQLKMNFAKYGKKLK